MNNASEIGIWASVDMPVYRLKQDHFSVSFWTFASHNIGYWSWLSQGTQFFNLSASQSTAYPDTRNRQGGPISELNIISVKLHDWAFFSMLLFLRFSIFQHYPGICGQYKDFSWSITECIRTHWAQRAANWKVLEFEATDSNRVFL